MFFGKDESQPRKGVAWTLAVGVNPPVSSFSWADIQRALEALIPDGNSFVILEQKDGKEYWFIQSAIALAGPHKGEYTVGCGYSGKQGSVLLERMVPRLDQVIPCFESAYQKLTLDLSGFEDQSSWLPANQKK